VIHVGVLERNK